MTPNGLSYFIRSFLCLPFLDFSNDRESGLIKTKAPAWNLYESWLWLYARFWKCCPNMRASYPQWGLVENCPTISWAAGWKETLSRILSRIVLQQSSRTQRRFGRSWDRFRGVENHGLSNRSISMKWVRWSKIMAECGVELSENAKALRWSTQPTLEGLM